MSEKAPSARGRSRGKAAEAKKVSSRGPAARRGQAARRARRDEDRSHGGPGRSRKEPERASGLQQSKSISMNITLLRQPLGSVQAQWLVLGVFEDESEPPTELRGTALEEVVKRLIAEKDVTGSLGELTPLYDVRRVPGAARCCWSGLGPRDRFDAGAAFSAGFAFSKRLASKRREDVAVALPPSNEPACRWRRRCSKARSSPPAARASGKAKPTATPSSTLSLVIEPEHSRRRRDVHEIAAPRRDRRPTPSIWRATW